MSYGTTYQCAGLAVQTALELPAPLTDGPPDVHVTVRPPEEIPFQRPSSEVIAERLSEGFAWYSICRVGARHTIRFYGVADFHIQPSSDEVVCVPDRNGDASIIPLVFIGGVVAYLNVLRERFVLHASAVELDDGVLGFVGASGAGKSTMAALLCADGFPLFADDLLPIVLGEGSVECLRGAHELRLRDGSASLVDEFGPGVIARTTVDLRHAVAPVYSGAARLPLRCLIFPRPDREHPAVAARRLGAAESALALARCHRIEGWQDATQIRQQFEAVADLAGRVPIYEVSVPWGPPFARTIARATLEACGLRRLEDVAR